MKSTLPLLTVLLLLPLLQAQPPACFKKPDSGPCEALITSYFYDPATRTCKPFNWGGCKGVVPFKSLATCQKADCSACTAVPDTGPCKAKTTRWFFDNHAEKCRKFVWGGCDGRVPFKTKKDCLRAKCVPVESPSPKPLSAEERCNLTPVRGPCLRKVKRWFFDHRVGACVNFEWGGCFGAVPFRTELECTLASCVVNSCKLPHSEGRCPYKYARYFFDEESKTCEVFFWSGCGGLIPFGTREDCEAKCVIKNPCRLLPDSGECDKDTTKYFYNAGERRCSSFVWGGCVGTVPFETLAECEKRKCQCSQKADSGPCREKLPRYYFDAEAQKCKMFTWGGCHGSVPFDSEEECKKAECGK